MAENQIIRNIPDESCKTPCVCALRIAIADCNVELVKALSADIDLNFIHSDNRSALQASIEIGNFLITKYLLENGSKFDHKTSNSCLNFILKLPVKPAEQILQLLLEYDTSINNINECLFCKYIQDAEKIRLLLDIRWDINVHLLHDNQPLILRFFINNWHIIGTNPIRNLFNLFIQKGVDFNAQDGKGLSILHHAILRIDLQISDFLQVLIEKGLIDVNLPDLKGRTPIEYSMRIEPDNNYLFFPLQLLRAGAKIPLELTFLTDFLHLIFKTTPIDLMPQNLEMLQLLFDYNPTILNSKTYSSLNLNPLHMAIKSYTGNQISQDLITFLVERGTNLDIVDSDGKTPLYYAQDNIVWKIVAKSIPEHMFRPYLVQCFEKNHMTTEILRMLFNRSPTILKSLMDRFEKNLLHLASNSFSVEVLEQVLKYGLDVNSCDIHHKTPIDYSRETKNIELLIKSGATSISKSDAEEIMLIAASSSVEITNFILKFYPSLVNMDCGRVDSQYKNLTPICIAACSEKNSLALVTNLIRLGAIIDDSKPEKSPIQYAIAFKNYDTVSFFVNNFPKLVDLYNQGEYKCPLENLIDIEGLWPDKRVSDDFYLAFCSLMNITKDLVICLRMFRKVMIMKINSTDQIRIDCLKHQYRCFLKKYYKVDNKVFSTLKKLLVKDQMGMLEREWWEEFNRKREIVLFIW
ncbi:hypothetical protein HK096_004408, partial [Nowakowskiella sp. JEL0078]